MYSIKIKFFSGIIFYIVVFQNLKKTEKLIFLNMSVKQKADFIIIF